MLEEYDFSLDVWKRFGRHCSSDEVKEVSSAALDITFDGRVQSFAEEEGNQEFINKIKTNISLP